MRKDWKYLPLGEICEFISGFTPQKHELNEKEGVPYYKVSDMNRDVNSLYMSETDLFVAHPRKTIPANSIIFPKNGGAIFTGKKRILKYDSIIDLNTEAINIKDKNIDLLFLYSFLLGIDFGQFDNGGGLPSINIRKMKEFIVPVPPLSEQERIVSLLDTQFAKIDALKANAASQLQAAKDLFQAALKQLLTPKESWERKLLKDISTYYNGLTYKPIDVSDNGFLVLRSSNIQDNILTLEDQVRVSVDINDKLKVHKGDIIMCSRNGSKALIGKVAIIPEEYDDMTFGTFMMVFKGEYNPFLYYFFLSDLFKKQIWRGEATMINQITRYMLDEVYVSLPSLPEQERIAARLDKISEKVKALQANYDQTINLCNDLKQSLLKSIFE